MIVIRLSAEDERIIRGAKLPEELVGARQLVLDRIAQSKLMREFGKVPKEKPRDFRWKEALEVAKETLGDQVTFPKITDYLWYKRVNGAIMHDGLDAEYVTKLSEFVKANMRLPIKFEFMICQHRRIMEGEFVQQRQESKQVDMRAQMGPELPDE